MVSSTEVDLRIQKATGLPLVSQWFCNSCAASITGVVGTRQ
ncbi:unnamed protein product [Choristocarpus tenellus]